MQIQSCFFCHQIMFVCWHVCTAWNSLMTVSHKCSSSISTYMPSSCLNFSAFPLISERLIPTTRKRALVLLLMIASTKVLFLAYQVHRQLWCHDVHESKAVPLVWIGVFPFTSRIFTLITPCKCSMILWYFPHVQPSWAECVHICFIDLFV